MGSRGVAAGDGDQRVTDLFLQLLDALLMKPPHRSTQTMTA